MAMESVLSGSTFTCVVSRCRYCFGAEAFKPSRLRTGLGRGRYRPSARTYLQKVLRAMCSSCARHPWWKSDEAGQCS